MIQVKFQTEKTLSLFIHSGRVLQVYIQNHRIPSLDWEVPLNMYRNGRLEIHPMPSRALMFRKILLEELSPVPSQPAGTNQLKVMFDLAESNTNPTLFHIQWESAEGFVLLAGRSIPIRHAVLLTKAGAQEGRVAQDQIQAWDEARCQVAIHRGDIKSQAWLEVHLNILFERYCQNIMQQYGQLTGTVMVRSILQSLAVLAEINGWTISTQDHRLADASLFPSAADAADAYREMLFAIKTRIEPIIGNSLTQNLRKQSIDSTRDVYRTIQEIFGLIGDAQS